MLTNSDLERLTAEQRIEKAAEFFQDGIVLSSSFGAQAAVMLHLSNSIVPNIPVVLIDTGYLFPETYQFIEQMQDRLNLNLHVYRAEHSAAWQEAKFGQLWKQGIKGIEKYNTMNKVEPMQRAMKEMNATCWLSGIRRQQSRSRIAKPFIEESFGVHKVYPILDWSDRDVHKYLTKNGLPYHPLWFKGYVSIGDVHTTKKLSEVETIEETRFFGLKRECGLHA